MSTLYASLKYMHSFLIEKFDLDFNDDKFLITSVINTKIFGDIFTNTLLFETYNIDKSSLSRALYL
jgi:hypothetical protein